MSDEQREAVRAANRKRAKHHCPRCGGSGRVELDGSDSMVGGVPGVKYRYCGGCGRADAVTHRQRKFRL